MKKKTARFAILSLTVMILFMFNSCGSTESSENTSESGSSSNTTVSETESSSDADSEDMAEASESESEESSEFVDDYNEDGSHTVDLCNGFGQDVVSLKIRSGSSDEDYWSYEILNGENWSAGTAISLTLNRDEWGDAASGWEAEVTLTDGTVQNYTELPLSTETRIELSADGFRSDNQND